MKWILLSALVLIALSNVSGEDVEEHWSGCWTAFPASSSICRSEFGAEFDSVKSEGCGILSAGRKTLCKKTYPGCKSTNCYSLFVADQCKSQFGDTLPKKSGQYTDCAPGFIRTRCCPKD